MKRLVIIVSAMVSPVIFADVPHTFTAGTPAKASEVNQNFNILDSDIKSANAHISALESADGETNQNYNALDSDIKSVNARISSLESASENVEDSCDNSIDKYKVKSV